MKNRTIKKIRRYLVYLAVVTVRAVVYPLSFNAKSNLGSFLGALAYKFMKSARQTAIGNVRRALPKIGKKETERIAEESFRNIGKNVLEAIHLEKMTPEDINELTEYEGLEYFDKSMKEGKGGITITGHM